VNRRRKPACAPAIALPGPGSRPLFPHVFVFSSLFGPQTAANPNHSPTSAAFARKSNHSRTYAKTGGYTPSFRDQPFHFGNTPRRIFLQHSLPCRTLQLGDSVPVELEIPAFTGTAQGKRLDCELSTDNCELPFPGGGGQKTLSLLRHGQLLPYESYLLQYVPLHYVSMSARRHFGVRRLAAAFAVDRGAPYSLFRRNGLRRKSGSKLPHSKASFRQHDRMSLWSYR